KAVESLLNENNKEINIPKTQIVSSLEENKSNTTLQNNQTQPTTNSFTLEQPKPKEEIKEQNNTTTQEVNRTQNNEEATIEQTLESTLKEVTLNLKSKRLWVGIYNLESGKKESKIIRAPLRLDLTQGNLALVTGHGKIEIVANDETKTPPNAKKQYILISKDEGVKFITRQEYKELTNKKGW
ncbi:MAG: hypothetical protein GXN91_03370, partial [Epsilonproteobacteria bacterium]|nr:hypothetical protein [Campylobacterota bacterium]